MRRLQWNDVALVAGVAVLTAAALVVPLLPSAVTAGGGEAGPTALIERPVLESHGCELSIVPTSSKHETGDRFLATLHVTNPTDEAARVPVVVALMETPPSQPMARMVSMPIRVWGHEELVAVGPGETVTVALRPDALLKKGRHTAYHLQVGEQGGVMAYTQIPGLDLAVQRPVPLAEGR